MHRCFLSPVLRTLMFVAAVAGGSFCLAPLSVAAQEAEVLQVIPEPIRMDLSFKLPKGQPILVENAYGSVHMRFGGYEHQLDIRATIQQPDAAAEFAFKPAPKDGRFVVVPVLPEGATLAEGQRVDLVLYVPQGHAVMARSTFGVLEGRNLMSDLDMTAVSGDITLRGVDGTVQAQTEEGRIEVTFKDQGARAGSLQRIATRTGNITVNVSDKLDAEFRLSTSHQFSTDYSLTVRHRDGSEPNKTAVAVVGSPKPGNQKAEIVLESLVGEVRLQRKGVFIDSISSDSE